AINIRLRWSREWELPLSPMTISAGEADSRRNSHSLPKIRSGWSRTLGRRGKTAWPCTSGPGMPSKSIRRDPYGNGSEALVTGGEVLPEMIERECEKCPCSRIIRPHSRLQSGLEVEWSLLDREEGLQYLLVESDLDVSAQSRWNVGIVG